MTRGSGNSAGLARIGLTALRSGWLDDTRLCSVCRSSMHHRSVWLVDTIPSAFGLRQKPKCRMLTACDSGVLMHCEAPLCFAASLGVAVRQAERPSANDWTIGFRTNRRVFQFCTGS